MVCSQKHEYICNLLFYLKLYLRSIRNRDWDKLNREKNLFMRESKMGDCNRHLNSKLFVSKHHSPKIAAIKSLYLYVTNVSILSSLQCIIMEFLRTL